MGGCLRRKYSWRKKENLPLQPKRGRHRSGRQGLSDRRRARQGRLRARPLHDARRGHGVGKRARRDGRRARPPEERLAPAAQPIQSPPAPKSDVVDDYHGTKVADPYRGLEDPDAPATRGYIEAENRLTEAYLAGIPARERIRERLRRLWDYPKYGAPFHKAGRYFYFKNDGLQNQSVLYTQAAL